MNFIRIDHDPRVLEHKKEELKKVLKEHFETFQEQGCHYLIETEKDSVSVYELLQSQVQGIENLSVLDHTALAHIHGNDLPKILKSLRESMTLHVATDAKI
jgi:hypothetical protein